MEDRVYKIKMYLYDEPVLDDIYFYQNDTNTCTLEFEFYRNRKDYYDLSNSSVVLIITKNDGTSITETLTSINGVYQYELSNNAIDNVGNNKITIQAIGQNNDRVTFGSFKYKLTKDTVIGNIASDTNYPILVKLISDANNVITNEPIRITNENIRIENEVKRIANDGFREKDYASLKSIIIDENQAANLQNQINTSNSQLADIKQNQVSYPHNFSSSALISFIDDDGNVTTNTIMKPLLDGKGLKGNMCMITNNIDKPNCMTLEQLKKYNNDGGGVYSHTMSHAYLTRISEQECENEIKGSKDLLNSYGFRGDILIYPYGDINPTVRKIARKHCVCGIDIPVYGKYNNFPIENMNIYRKECIGENNNTITLQTCKNYVDEALSNGQWLVFMTHSHYPAWQTQSTKNDFLALLDYIIGLNIEVVTIEEGLKLKGNILETGDFTTDNFRIGRNGMIGGKFADDIMGKLLNDRNIDATNPISYFPKTISYKYFSYSQAQGKGFPEANAGLLETYRVPSDNNSNDGDFASSQFFYPYSNDKIYRRRWDNELMKWTSFINITPLSGTPEIVTLDSMNNKTTLNNLSSFPINKITYTPISFANSDISNFPKQNAGMLITTHLGSIDSLNYQEYRLYDNSNMVYTRKWLDGNMWSNWSRRYDGYNKNVVITTGDISANSYKELEIQLVGLSTNDTVIATPRGGLETCVYNVFIERNDCFKIRFLNISSSIININRTFAINIINN